MPPSDPNGIAIEGDHGKRIVFTSNGEQYAFYPDRLTASLNTPIGFSPLVVTKPEKMIIKLVEIHTHTWELLLPMNDDMIIHVSPPNGTVPKPELTEAFIVPKGTLVKLQPAVWHLNPVPVHEKTLCVMAAVAQCTYLNDCILVNLDEEQQMAEETPLPGLSAGQEDVMESGQDGQRTTDVTTSKAQAENTQVLTEKEDTSTTTEPVAENPETQLPENPETEDTAAPVQPEMNFTEDSSMLWPVSGQVAIDYSMDATTYFSTLDQYKYNSALVMSAAVGDPVQAAANGQVVSIKENEETGITVTLDMGNGYQTVYGQLKDLAVEEGQIVESGTVLGYINDPAKYYVKEGPNLYFAMTKDSVPVDPMIFMEAVTE